MLLALASTLIFSNVEAKEKNHKQVVHKHSRESVELSSLQKHNLSIAFNIAKSDGHKNPYLLPGLIMVESTAGAGQKFRSARHKPRRDQSVGIAQIIASTARSVVAHHPELKKHIGNRGLAYDLANNDVFNIHIASAYLSDLSKNTHSEAALIAAYNTGHIVRRPEKMAYVRKVQKNINKMRREL